MNNTLPPIPDELLIPFSDDVLKKVGTEENKKKYAKYLNHNETIEVNWWKIHKFLHDFLNPSNKFIDVSCGNGAVLEILRWYGCDYLGLDRKPEYIELINDKKLNFKKYNCSKTPYPFKDGEFDVVINHSAITYYGPPETWPRILDEFKRISKKCIFLGVNRTPEYISSGEEVIKKWIENSGLILELQISSCYKLIHPKKN